jgi:hypothetical protein
MADQLALRIFANPGQMTVYINELLSEEEYAFVRADLDWTYDTETTHWFLFIWWDDEDAAKPNPPQSRGYKQNDSAEANL